jgi:hypothetical protein
MRWYGGLSKYGMVRRSEDGVAIEVNTKLHDDEYSYRKDQLLIYV